MADMMSKQPKFHTKINLILLQYFFQHVLLWKTAQRVDHINNQFHLTTDLFYLAHFQIKGQSLQQLFSDHKYLKHMFFLIKPALTQLFLDQPTSKPP